MHRPATPPPLDRSSRAPSPLAPSDPPRRRLDAEGVGEVDGGAANRLRSMMLPLPVMLVLLLLLAEDELTKKRGLQPVNSKE